MEANTFELMNMSNVYRTFLWAVVPTVLAFGLVMFLRLRRGGRGLPSSQVPKTTLGTLGGAVAPEASLIAGLGQNARPQETLGTLILRPSFGMRVYPVLLLGLFVYLFDQMYISGPNGDSVYFGPIDLGFSALLIVLILHSILYFNVYELRYDREGFVHRSWLLQRRQFDWSKLLMLRDDNGFFYVVHGSIQGKAYIPKHLTGIEDFVQKVQTQIRMNDAY